MPLVFVYTNLRQEDIPQDFEVSISKHVAEVLNKPIELITTFIEANKRMCRNAESTPTCILRINSMTAFDPQRNPGYLEKFIDFMKHNLKIAGERVVVQLTPDELDYLGFGN